MIIFRRTQRPVGGIISGGKNPAVPSLLRDREIDGAKVNTNLIKIITNLNKIKKKIKTFWKIISSFTWNF